jgi:cephalosporin-C deacetylase
MHLHTHCHGLRISVLMLCLLLSSLSSVAQQVNQHWRLPVAFEKSDAMLDTPYESYRLPVRYQAEAGKAFAVEVEHASTIHLSSAERLLMMDDAAGGLAARQMGSFTIKFDTPTEATYTMWFRCKANPKSGICGPHHESVDGQTYTFIDTRRMDKAGGWMWLKGTTRTLAAGAHSWVVWGDLFLYGAVVDRVLLVPDQQYVPSDDDPGPPARYTAAMAQGQFISEAIRVPGVKRWSRIEARTHLDGGSVQWAYQVEGGTAWTPISPNSALPTATPFKLRLTLVAGPNGGSPLVDSVRLVYEGDPFTAELAPGVRYTALPDGGCQVQTAAYQITFAANGRMASMQMGGRELIEPGDSGWAGGKLVFNQGVHVQLAAPDLLPDRTVAIRGREATQRFTFKDDRMLMDFATHGGHEIVGPGDLTYSWRLHPELKVDRIVERNTGRVAAVGEEARHTPQIFFTDGSSIYLEAANPGLPAFTRYERGPEQPPTLAFWFNTANYVNNTVVFRPKPLPADVLQMNITCTKSDHTYALGEAIGLRVHSALLYGQHFNGKARLTVEKVYAGPGQEEVVKLEQPIDLPAGTTTPVSWNFTLKTPGLYRGSYEVLEGEQSLRKLQVMILHGPEALHAPPPPADYAAFWQRAMAQLQQIPIAFTRQTSGEQQGYLRSRIQFTSINGRPAWGDLAEPKEDGKYPAILKLPPVGTAAPGIDLNTERGYVVLGVEVFGHDSTWSVEQINDFYAKGGMKYEPLGTRTVLQKPEEFWHYYAYCTIARAYDILEQHPKVDPRRIYITGASQGGGLTLAAAGLRPQNAGALSVVPGICRLDWANTNGGAWGPRFPNEPQYALMKGMVSYFDTAYLVRNLRSRLVMFIGLQDTHTPPHAAASVFNEVPEGIRERRLLIAPWVGHSGISELATYIPRWTEEDNQ